MKRINVGTAFHQRLVNRDRYQSDGSHNAVQFRERYLSELDSQSQWVEIKPYIELDFSNVKKIGPSFANEAFAYFTQYAKPGNILERIVFTNIERVFMLLIVGELESGYRRK